MPRDTVPGFAERLRQLMAAAGLSQSALALRSGVSQSAVSGLLADGRAPSLLVAAKLARVLGCSVDDLIPS